MLREIQRLIADENDAMLRQSTIQIQLVAVAERPCQIDVLDQRADQRFVTTDGEILMRRILRSMRSDVAGT
ncbi:hypothetical protein V1283_006426 [Bradyrhizobium sp. AZCC 2262]|uniref:hypothetical protein n=1 Tax=Bradyrhizobium sp. AZCC 2262 TaxID=3117022 RepID=UPI002FF3133A